VAVPGVDPEAGAVYIPLPSIVPSAPDPETDQVTDSDAENCFIPPSGTLALVGVTVKPEGGGCELELTDWHATMIPVVARDRRNNAANNDLEFLRIAQPKINPLATGMSTAKAGMGRRNEEAKCDGGVEKNTWTAAGHRFPMSGTGKRDASKLPSQPVGRSDCGHATFVQFREITGRHAFAAIRYTKQTCR